MCFNGCLKVEIEGCPAMVCLCRRYSCEVPTDGTVPFPNTRRSQACLQPCCQQPLYLCFLQARHMQEALNVPLPPPSPKSACLHPCACMDKRGWMRRCYRQAQHTRISKQCTAFRTQNRPCVRHPIPQHADQGSCPTLPCDPQSSLQACD